MRDLERDVLLASTGELSWWRRLRLARRLRRDPEARRLAETLAVTELVLGPAPARAASRPIAAWIATGTVAVAALGLAVVLWAALRGRIPTGPRPGAPPAVAAPLYESTGRLLVAGYAMTPHVELLELESADAPLLPPWSAALEDERVWYLIDERSQ